MKTSQRKIKKAIRAILSQKVKTIRLRRLHRQTFQSLKKQKQISNTEKAQQVRLTIQTMQEQELLILEKTLNQLPEAKDALSAGVAEVVSHVQEGIEAVLSSALTCQEDPQSWLQWWCEHYFDESVVKSIENRGKEKVMGKVLRDQQWIWNVQGHYNKIEKGWSLSCHGVKEKEFRYRLTQEKKNRAIRKCGYGYRFGLPSIPSDRLKRALPLVLRSGGKILWENNSKGMTPSIDWDSININFGRPEAECGWEELFGPVQASWVEKEEGWNRGGKSSELVWGEIELLGENRKGVMPKKLREHFRWATVHWVYDVPSEKLCWVLYGKRKTKAIGGQEQPEDAVSIYSDGLQQKVWYEVGFSSLDFMEYWTEKETPNAESEAFAFIAQALWAQGENGTGLGALLGVNYATTYKQYSEDVKQLLLRQELGRQTQVKMETKELPKKKRL